MGATIAGSIDAGINDKTSLNRADIFSFEDKKTINPLITKVPKANIIVQIQK